MSRILLVEDDLDSCEALSQLLLKRGHAVDCVPNGRAALAAILSTTPELVVLDLSLPEMDGVRLLEIIRSYLRLQSLPVIVWTGLGDSPIVERAKTFNVDSVVSKGKANFDDLLEAIAISLKSR